jgi:tRNA/rRNA methyltransferase
MLLNCRVVLVRTHYAGNIGSAARAMANFGLRDLVLVDPVADPAAHQARMLAAGGVEVLDGLRVVPTLDDTVADCGMVLATAGETLGTGRQTIVGGPAEVLPRFVTALAGGPAAVVFGPEPHGLTTAEIVRCHGLLCLPTDPGYTSLNLALAVGLTLYELRRHAVGAEPTARPPAPFADLDRAFGHLDRALRELRFLYGQNADQLMDGVRHLIGRALPTAQEVKMLHGLARQLEYAADQMRKAESLTSRDRKGAVGDPG